MPQPLAERQSNSSQQTIQVVPGSIVESVHLAWTGTGIEDNYGRGMMLFDRDAEDFRMRTVMELYRREISHEQMQKFEGYMAEIFEALGMDLNAPATYETPQRFVQ